MAFEKLLLMASNYYFYIILFNLFHISLISMSSLYTLLSHSALLCTIFSLKYCLYGLVLVSVVPTHHCCTVVLINP